MKSLLKRLLYLLSIVYLVQFVICLFSNDADKWSRWISIEFHLGLCCACLFVGLA